MKSRKFYISTIILVFLNLIASYFSLIPAYITQQIFDQMMTNFNFNYLLIIISLLFVFFLCHGFISILNTLYYVKQLNYSSLTFRNKYLSAFLSKDYGSLEQYSEGDIIYRGNTDVQHICELSYELIFRTFTQIIFLLGVIILMFRTNVLLSICVLILMFAEYLYNFLSSNKLKNKLIKVKESESNLLETYKQIINRYIYIRLNRLQKEESKRFYLVIKEALNYRKNYLISQSYLSGITGLISGARQMFVLVLGAYLISKGKLTIGVLMAFNQLVYSLTSPMQFFSSWIHYYKDLLSSYERIKDIMDTKTFIEYYPITDEPGIKLKCNNVSFELNGKKLLNDLNLTIYSKEKVAIVGESGSGKSTLCKLIAGLYKYQGTISMEENKSSEKTTIGFMLDESSIFRGSLLENITYGLKEEQIDIDNIRKVLNQVKLEYLFDKTEGLNTLVDKNTLSKGEKQRLELARIILSKPQLIILDEPTSGLDDLTEQIVWGNFRRECNDSTILYTTHHKKIIYSTDRVLQISNGKINNAVNITENYSLRFQT
ncbi:ATP-binding cassette domain-containing protein [Paenibacillus barengoltzii]|uniref:ATP-binding cassette domain-containing protein n=1 Tax=Paenibacillus barengoltzii TaxID=343517 RepID=UPI00387A4F8D